jgi:primary-amine oxidase
MADTLARPTATETSGHPLDALTLAELELAARLVLESGCVGERPVLAWIGLQEPPKAAVVRWRPGDAALPRQALAVAVDRATGVTYEALVDLGSGVLVRADAQPGKHAPILSVEWVEAGPAVRADERVLAALSRRGIDPTTVEVEPWPAAYFDEEVDRLGRRIGRAVLFVREHPGDSLWARPIEGLLVIADRSTGEVLEVRDSEAVALPSDPGRMQLDELRTDLTPLVISQPDGPGFALDGNLLTWQRWRMRLSVHPVEGLVLHELAYDDPATGTTRPICYRASLGEMVVPYADPGPLYYWRHVFDAGEAALGRNTTPLTLGCDCLGEIRYLDAPMIGMDGQPTTIPNAVCIHEEDAGVLWRHLDWRADQMHVRRSRRLVVSSWCNLGNYDYGFFWYFYLDGSFEMDVKLTGVPVATAHAAGTAPTHGALVGRDLSAPHHQHLFCFRLDLDVDGGPNVVEEVDLVADPIGPANPYGTAFHTEVTVLEREGVAARDIAPAASRTWRVRNPSARNSAGEPTGYALLPGAQPLLLAHPDSPVARRAGFATHHLWVTQHADDELHPAGEYPNQHPGGDGLPAWVAADRPLVDQDVVLWFTCGSNHVSRPEDWPVMPVEHAGFLLKPAGFFDRNPALDVPPQELINPDGAHCH